MSARIGLNKQRMKLSQYSEFWVTRHSVDKYSLTITKNYRKRTFTDFTFVSLLLSLLFAHWVLQRFLANFERIFIYWVEKILIWSSKVARIELSNFYCYYFRGDLIALSFR